MTEQGICKWFNAPKGYGFITRADGSELFVHYSGIQAKGYRTLDDGDKVSFEVIQGFNGVQAVDVVKIP